jgi:hypothetical protein
MSSTDWESRELEEASRERLLTEIGVLKDSLQQVHATSRVGELESELISSREQALQAQHELLAARDYAMGAAAHAGEQQAQFSAQSAQLAAAQERVAFLSKHINRMRNSTTWKLGRIAMLPVRVANRILRRSS